MHNRPVRPATMSSAPFIPGVASSSAASGPAPVVAASLSSQTPAAAQARRRWIPSAAPAAAARVGGPAVEPLELERVLGHTCASNVSAAYNPAAPSEFAYTAGSAIVVFDQRSGVQKRFLKGRRGHEIHAVAYSPEGEWIIAGEKGAGAAVLVWSAATGHKIATIVGHAGTVTAVKASPLRDYLVVISDEVHAGAIGSNIAVWRLSDHQLVWSHTGETVAALDWGADNSYFVVGGKHFLRFMYLKPKSGAEASHSSTSLNSDPSYTRPLVDLEIREGKLVKNEKAEFVALVCGRGVLQSAVFALSKHGQGVVCVFTQKGGGSSTSTSNSGGALPDVSSSQPGAAGSASAKPLRWEIEKWMDVRMPDATSLSVHEDILAVGGGESKLRVFVASSLKHVDTLPKPSPTLADRKVYPNLLLATLAPGASAATTTKILAAYSDRTLCVWDISRKPATITRSFASHAGPVWDIALLPLCMAPLAKKRRAFHDVDYDSEEDERAAKENAKRNESKLPEGSFATCSADNCIRIWNVNATATGANTGSSASGSAAAAANTSPECLRTIYVPPAQTAAAPGGPSALAASAAAALNGGIKVVKFLPGPASAPSSSSSSSAAGAAASAGLYASGLLASGDKAGYVRLHDLRDFKQLAALEIHDSDVRALDFQQPQQQSSATGAATTLSSLPLLLSASRDTTIHIHNVSNPLAPQTYTPEVVHKGAVTAVKILTMPAAPAAATAGSTGAAGAEAERRTIFLSGGLDRQFVLHSLSLDPSAGPAYAADTVEFSSSVRSSLQFPRANQVLDVVVHPSLKFAAILCNNTEKRKEAAALAAGAGAATAAGAAAGKYNSRPVNCVIHLFDLVSMHPSRTYHIQSLAGGDPLRMVLDPSGLLLAISFSDRSILIVDWFTGGVLASVWGHSQPVQAMVFTADCRALLSVGKEGCVMQWRIEPLYVKAMQTRLKELNPTPAAAADAKKKASSNTSTATTSGKSTALALLSDDEDEEEPEDEKPAAVAAAPVAATAAASTSAAAPGLPPLAPGGSSPKGAAAAAPVAAYKPRMLPSWARSTVVSPDSGSAARAGTGAAADSPHIPAALPAGGGLGLAAGGVERTNEASASGAGTALPVPGLPRGRWAERVTVDAVTGLPLAPAVAATGLAYGDMGTIGVSTMLLEGDSALGEEDGVEPAAAEGEAAAAEEEEDEDIEEEELDSEESASSLPDASAAAAGGTSASAGGNGAGNLSLGSSLTARHFQKLRESGAFGAAADSPAHPHHAPRDALRLGQNFNAREAATTAESQQIRAQLRNMGILDDPSKPAGASHAATGAAAAADPAPSLEGTSELVAVAPAPDSALHGHATVLAESLTSALPPLPNSPEATVTSPPVAASNMGARSSSNSNNSSQSASSSSSSSNVSVSPSVHASLQALPSQIAHFQSSLQQMLEGFGQVRQVLDSRPQSATGAGVSNSTALIRSTVGARPQLAPTAIQSVSVSLSFAAVPASSGGQGGATTTSSSALLPFVSPSVLAGSNMDLDTLEAVYEAQLDTMEALLAQARPQRRLQQQQQSQTQAQQSQSGSVPMLMPAGSPVSRPSESSPSGGGTFLTQSAVSPSSAALQQTLTLQQSAAVMDQLAEMRQMLQRIEATTLSTTQQLSLGLTLSGPNSVPAAFSSGRS